MRPSILQVYFVTRANLLAYLVLACGHFTVPQGVTSTQQNTQTLPQTDIFGRILLNIFQSACVVAKCISMYISN